MKAIVYTDGAAIPNPGKGGYAAIIQWDGKRKELVGAVPFTTNNRMEITAVLVAFQFLKEEVGPCAIILHSDSSYVVNSINSWMRSWEKKGWKKKNADLWKEMLELCNYHKVTAKWVKGHNGNPNNERCDELANWALR